MAEICEPPRYSALTFYLKLYRITEHPKTLQKLSKTIRQAKKLGSNSSLYSDTKKGKKILNKKNGKITKQTHAFRGAASSFNVEILNYFNLEVQLKDTESAIKSKLIVLLSELGGLRFVASLVLVFKKTESEDKTKYGTFYSNSEAEIIINESETDDVFQTVYTTVILNTQKSLRKGSGCIIGSVIDHIVSVSKYRIRPFKEKID